MNKTTECSVCGKTMKVRIDPTSKRPYEVQMCSDSCMWEAFGIVTSALERGVKPNYRGASIRKKYKRLDANIVQEIMELYYKGYPQKAIAAQVETTQPVVSRVIKENKNNKVMFAV